MLNHNGVPLLYNRMKQYPVPFSRQKSENGLTWQPPTAFQHANVCHRTFITRAHSSTMTRKNNVGFTDNRTSAKYHPNYRTRSIFDSTLAAM